MVFETLRKSLMKNNRWKVIILVVILSMIAYNLYYVRCNCVSNESFDTIDKDDMVAKMQQKLEELEQVDAKIKRVNTELEKL